MSKTLFQTDDWQSLAWPTLMVKSERLEEDDAIFVDEDWCTVLNSFRLRVVAIDLSENQNVSHCE